MNRLRLALAALTVALMLLLPAAALAGTPSPLADCQAHQGQLTRTYTVAQLRHALAAISPSVREYTTCDAAIQTQLNGLLGTPGTPVGNLGNAAGSGSGGGSGTTILVIILVVVVLGGAGAAAVAWRRNRGDGALG